MNDQIKNYIEEAVRAGKSMEDIKQSLLAFGWQEADIEEALAAPAAPTTAPVVEVAKQRSSSKLAWTLVAILAIIIVIGAVLFFLKPSAPASPLPVAVPVQTQPVASTTPVASVAPTTPTTTAPPSAVAATCTDSNASLGANAIYTQGTVTSIDSTGNAQKLTDDCGDATHLIEYICYESPVGSGHYASGRTIVQCPKGCANGACKK